MKAKKLMKLEDEFSIQQRLFDFVHEVEAQYGLRGVRLIKSWCIEKLPFGAFERGYFDGQKDELTHSICGTRHGLNDSCPSNEQYCNENEIEATPL